MKGDPQRRLQVDPTCKRVIGSLRNLSFKRSEATAHMAIAISKGLTPWTVGRSESISVW